MAKIDLKKSLRELFNPPKGTFVETVVPELTFVKVDGAGDPNTTEAFQTSVKWLYGVSYAMKFAAKAQLGRDYVVPPLEGLWWSDDPGSFVRRDKDRWQWTVMIMVPDFVSRELFDKAVEKTAAKHDDKPGTLRFEPYEEGRVLQALHVGSYDDEGPLLKHLHDEVMPALGVGFNGPHHEIYLSDPRKTEAARLKTILRQPIRNL